jgi:type II secretory pathway pseudopilin PulG
MKKPNGNGFSLVEMMLAMTLTIIVMVAVLTLIISTQRASLTESMKQEMNQEARALQQVLSESFKSSGAMLSILSIPSLLGTPVVFNGIYPFNNSNYADGVILAAGDPEVVTRTTSAFNSAGTQLDVLTTKLLGTMADAWAVNDIGMIVRPADGCYYVFRVTAVSDAFTLAVDTDPVYYSGLIKSVNTDGHYNDACTLGTGSYESNSLVLRLDYFYIFLARDEDDGTRSLTLTTDTGGSATFLDDPNSAVPIIRNIEDIQFAYVLKDGTIEHPANNDAFLNKTVASVRVFILNKTEEQKHKGVSTVGPTYVKPAMGDRAQATLPAGLFNYHYSEYELFLRNFNTIY